MSRLLLASSSPRRREILAQMGISHVVLDPNVDETPNPGVSPWELARELAHRKAAATVERISNGPPSATPGTQQADLYILAADTVVAMDDHLMGKPKDRTEAGRFLAALAGRTHVVHTAVALAYQERFQRSVQWRYAVDCDSTSVTFAALSSEEISWYLDTSEWEGVAGGYRIQERGACLVERICGTYSTVVGLPIRLVYSMLSVNGFEL